MRVMGIDPGTREAGFGVIDQAGNRLAFVDCGVVRASRNGSVPDRLRAIFEGLRDAVAAYRPEVVSIEEVFYGKNVAAALRMGEGRGVAMVAAAQPGVEIVEYSAASIKRSVVGNGRATKEQVQEMVRLVLGLREPPRPDHAADALAMAICHCNRSRLRARAD
jgi:crossover junction endodeoxyribonuclease RuvC